MIEEHSPESPTPPIPQPTTETQYALPHYEDTSQLHPLLSDFEEVAYNPHSIFPHKWLVYGGNYWDTLQKVVKPRGFTLVKSKDDESLSQIDFIWRPVQFPHSVYLKTTVVLCKD